MDDEPLCIWIVTRDGGPSYDVLTVTKEEGNTPEWSCARVYVNVWVSVEAVCRQPIIFAP